MPKQTHEIWRVLRKRHFTRREYLFPTLLFVEWNALIGYTSLDKIWTHATLVNSSIAHVMGVVQPSDGTNSRRCMQLRVRYVATGTGIFFFDRKHIIGLGVSRVFFTHYWLLLSRALKPCWLTLNRGSGQCDGRKGFDTMKKSLGEEYSFNSRTDEHHEPTVSSTVVVLVKLFIALDNLRW